MLLTLSDNYNQNRSKFQLQYKTIKTQCSYLHVKCEVYAICTAATSWRYACSWDFTPTSAPRIPSKIEAHALQAHSKIQVCQQERAFSWFSSKVLPDMADRPKNAQNHGTSVSMRSLDAIATKDNGVGYHGKRPAKHEYAQSGQRSGYNGRYRLPQDSDARKNQTASGFYGGGGTNGAGGGGGGGSGSVLQQRQFNTSQQWHSPQLLVNSDTTDSNKVRQLVQK